MRTGGKFGIVLERFSSFGGCENHTFFLQGSQVYLALKKWGGTYAICVTRHRHMEFIKSNYKLLGLSAEVMSALQKIMKCT